MSDLLEKRFMRPPTLFTWRRILTLIAVLFVIVALLVGGLFAQAKIYEDKVMPGLHIGSISVGGMTKGELKNFMNSMNDKLVNEGLHFSFEYNREEKSFLVQPVIVGEDSAIELIYIDIESEVDRIINYKKEGNKILRAFNFEKSRFTKPSIKLENIIIDEERLKSEIAEKLKEYEVQPKNASVKIESVTPLAYDLTPSAVGNIYDYDGSVYGLKNAWSVLEIPYIKIESKQMPPTILEDDVKDVLNRLSSVFDDGSLSLEYENPETRREYQWIIDVAKISEWINVQKTKENNIAFGLDKEKVLEYIDSFVSVKVNIDSKDAKFEIDELGKVVEFQGSRSGVELDTEQTYNALNQAIMDRTSHDEGIAKSVQVAVMKKEPNVSTAEANDLGITEVLGVGISDFSGSPTNRIKNIKNGVDKLNGILLKPEEEFSAIKFTEPYTEAGGYLPELVIKGDEIKPEIGGGLCQIGTTLFRMAMNSGMEITQRRNHSLVVNYYNDLENGLPGTDATIYDPAPDFRFKNDTDGHILIQTYMDETEQRLYFTLWGTSDGRNGYYERPVVEKWIPYGETQYVETTNLAPGQQKCQHAYTGAETNFKYIREMPDGETEETVFESYYRPLPQICLVGVEEKTENCFDENGQVVTECPADNEEDNTDPVVVE